MYVLKKVSTDGSVSYLSEVSLKPANWRRSLTPTLAFKLLDFTEDGILEELLDCLLVFNEKEDAYLFLGTMALMGLLIYEFDVVYVD